MREVEDFLHSWDDDGPDAEVKDVLVELYDYLRTVPGVALGWNARPGVSYSLRISEEQPPAERPFFAMIDIIDDDPEERWLSVCMYAALAADPEERGDVVPNGLNGQDALCFDVDEDDEEVSAYLQEVLGNMIAGIAR